MKENIQWVDSCRSTNTLMKETAAGLPHGSVIAAREQSAGRGQRGNSWEAQPDKNLTFSLLLRPSELKASEQFFMSEAVALGIVDALREIMPGKDNITIKWPNDIYVDNKKICGILIENSLSGTLVSRSIAGIGININQREFLSDAPNPVSIINITGIEHNLEDVLESVLNHIAMRWEFITSDRDRLHSDYFSSLYARNGLRYRDAASQEEFHATILAIAPSGHITLMDDDMNRRTYAFKEVTAIIPDN